MLRPLTAALAVLLLLSACQVRRGPAPAGVALLRIGAPVRLTDRAALSPAAWAPDGTSLAYADGRGLWIATVQGRERKGTAGRGAPPGGWGRGGGPPGHSDPGAGRGEGGGSVGGGARPPPRRSG